MTDLENAIIVKIYCFQFINTYISSFVYIFYWQDFKQLQANLVTIMVFKQIVFVLAEYYWLKISVRNKIRKVDRLFEDRIQKILDNKVEGTSGNDHVGMADLKMH